MNQIVRPEAHQNTAFAQYGVSDIERMARAIAGSRLFGIQTAEQAVTLCLLAQAEGRHPASAAQDYHLIQGKPSKKADAMLRDFLSAGGRVQWHALDDTIADATFSHPAGGSVRISWDMSRAKKAGIRNPMWDKYPRSMLRARVVSEGVRTVYPMATSGMYVPEEVQEFDAPREVSRETVTADGEIIEAKALPKAKSREPYAALRDKIDACQKLDELVALWKLPETQATLKTLPDDWREMIIGEKDAKRAKLFDPDAFLTNLFAELEDAHNEDQVQIVWDENHAEEALYEHQEKLEAAFVLKRQRLDAIASEADELK